MTEILYVGVILQEALSDYDSEVTLHPRSRLSSTHSTLTCIVSSDSSSARRDTNLGPVRAAMLRSQPMLMETLVGERRLDHSASFVHAVASA